MVDGCVEGCSEGGLKSCRTAVVINRSRWAFSLPPHSNNSTAQHTTLRHSTAQRSHNAAHLDDLRHGDARRRIRLQQPPQQRQARVRHLHPLRHLHLVAVHLPQHPHDAVAQLRGGGLVGGRREWEAAGQERVEDDAARPHVRLARVVAAAVVVQDLRGDVGERPHLAVGVRALVKQPAIPKVADLQDRLRQPRHRREQQVVELDVAVGHPAPVAVVDGDHQLLEEPARERLPQAAPLLHVVEHGARGRVLHHDVDAAAREEGLPERDHVGVVERAVVEDLGAHVVRVDVVALLVPFVLGEGG